MKIKKDKLIVWSILLAVVILISLFSNLNKDISKSELINDDNIIINQSEINSSEADDKIINKDDSKDSLESKESESIASQAESEIETVTESDVSSETEETVKPEETESEIIETSSEIIENQNIKGVWISYLSLMSKSEDEFKSNFINLINKAKDKGVTDVFVHVRAFADALYESEYFPVSHLVTGTQGDKLSFDPLEFMIEESHDLGLKFHAWINPLRIKTSGTPKSLSEDNVYNKYFESDPYFFIETESVTILNPAYSFVRELVSNGIREIVNNYNVDGIHFDDYFYPEEYDVSGDAAYKVYCENTDNPVSPEEFMCANINSLVALCRSAAKSNGTNVLFGISPQGNQKNNMKLGADTALWCKTKGYIDYICPQLYWSYDNPALGFREALDSWVNLEMHDELDLLVGLALYKIDTESDSGTWVDGSNMIDRQEKDALDKGARGVIYYEIAQLDKLN